MAAAKKKQSEGQVVTLASNTYRVRRADEWTVEECDRAMDYGLGFQTDAMQARSEAGEDTSALTGRLLALAQKLVKEKQFRDLLTIGLWPCDDKGIGLDYTEENARAHAETIANLREKPQVITEAVFSALTGFTVS